MYIRGLNAWNFADLAEAAPIGYGVGEIEYSHMRGENSGNPELLCKNFIYLYTGQLFYCSDRAIRVRLATSI